MLRRVVLLPLLLTACGLTARGSGAPDGGDLEGATRDAGTIDAGVEEDAAPPVPCSVEFDEPFATKGFDSTKWLATQNDANVGYPQPVVLGRNLVLMLEPTAANARGGLWYIPRVPFVAFDIDIDVQITCDDTSSCGDGLAIVFLDPTDELGLDAAGTASTLGIPGALDGGGVAIDLAKHTGLADGEAPNVSILEIDATKTPGAYPWTLTFSPPNDDLRNKPHRLALSMRQKQVTVKLDGAQVITGAMPRLPAEGTFGFTAASGSWTARVFFGDLHAKFYRCNAP